MTQKFYKNTFLWGFILWLVGYILGIILFAAVPAPMIGWFIMPLGIAVTLWVLWNKVKAKSLQQYLLIAVIWTLLAIILDYFLLVKIFKPADGYYKLDVYVYYATTFALPLLVYLTSPREKR